MAIPSARKTAPATTPEAPELLSVLVAQRVLSADQAEKVRRAQKVNGFSAEQAVLQLGVASDVQIAQAFAAHAGLPYVKINPLDLDLDVVTKAIAGPFARRHGMVAIAKSGNRITIAVHNPFAPFPLEDVMRVTGCEVDRVVATRGDVEAVNKGFYDLKSSLKHAEKQLSESRIATVDLGNQEFLSRAETDLDPAAAPVVKALDHILGYAFEQRASDIHFEPKRELTLVRLRIDGVLHDVHVIPKIVYEAVVSRIKLLSGANLAEKRRPQDGRIKREQGGREVELRVSTMPTAFGEKAVLRIFDPDILLKTIDELGLSPHDLPKFNEFIGRPTGIILVTGPTGSGKTTTLYSVLKHLSKPEVNIVTIEDPIEMVFEDFNQVQVRPLIDVTFSSSLRTVLRQDPDIIMVGEIRDKETADHAVQAALTGHLVLSTLHTNDAPSTVSRMVNMGIEPFLVGTAVNLIQAQRLVRRICAKCKFDDTANVPTKTLADIGFTPDNIGTFQVMKGKGCATCNGTGYKGRVGLYEVMEITEGIRDLIMVGATAVEIKRKALEEGMLTLRMSGLEKIKAGVTTVEEVLRETVL